jgi:lipopolysaccharide biosynthesis regulator YciM
MKKLISCFTLLVLMGNVRAEADVVACEEQQEVVRAEVVEAQQETRQITADEEAACRRIMEQLRECYAQLNLHNNIETALQAVADANRDDFDIAKHILGVQLEDGSWAWPIESRFLVK